MKRIIVLLIAISFGLHSMAQDTLPHKDSLTMLKVYGDIKAGVIGMAKALKAPVEHVYAIIVRQQLVNSITLIVVLLAGLGFLLFTYKKISTVDELSEGQILITVVTGTAGFIMMLIGLFCIDDIITGFVNPEYGALKDIINFVK